MTFRCSDAARDRGDPLIGTAPPARRWLLVEQPAGWGPDAMDSLLAPGVDKAQLAAALITGGARLQLIRRPTGGMTSLRWHLIDTEPPVRHRAGPLADGWAPVLAALRGPDDTRQGSTDEDPDRRMLLVCTNGRHDVCCALRGRPVAAALDAHFPGSVWECTHVGGDRFAANLIVLPDGAAYGALDPQTAAAVAQRHLEGRPDPRHLRGITGRAPHDQAALLAVAAELGVAPWDRRRLSTRAAAPSPGVAPAPHHRGWARDVLLDGRTVATVLGHDQISGAQQLTCSAPAPSRALVPTVDLVNWRPR